MGDSGSTSLVPVYDVPNIVRSMGNMLRGPRERYSTNFTDVFASDREVQYQYVNGLLAVMVAFVIVLIFWIFVLCVLKFKGDDVGCASGQPFQSYEGEEDLDSTDDESFCSLGSASHTDSQAEDENSVSKLISKNKDNLQNFSEEENAGGGGPPTGNTTRDEESFVNHSSAVKNHATKNRRERRTRFCFLMASLLSLVCVPLILVLSFGPMKEAVHTSDGLVIVARDTLLQVNISIESIEEAIASATETVKGATLDVGAICPDVNATEFTERIGIDLNELISSIANEYDSMTEISQKDIEFVRALLFDLEEGLIAFENSVEETNNLLWMIPAVLFSVSILTAVAMLGVLLVWRGKSGQKIQNFMSYVVLPLLMATALACWIILIFASLGTMLGSDVCTSSTSNGSPDETVQQILDVLNLDRNSTAFKVASAYTNRCIGPSPTEDLDGLQLIVQENIDTIWREVSRIDSLGRAQIMETCGATELEGLLLSARNVAKILTSIRRSLDSTSTSLGCERIYPIYASAAHDAVCTDAASAVAMGFFIFLVLSLSLMTMISLRAAWYQNIKAEKVYHDESEVAENMILDEHEEYLAYISKYKHEWQEYRGFDEKPIDEPAGFHDEGSYSDRSEGSSYFDEEYRSDAEGYNGSLEGSDDGSEVSDGCYQVTVVPTGSVNTRESGHKDGTESYDDISLPNFEAQESFASFSVAEEDLLRVPPPPANPEFRQDPRTSATAPMDSMSRQQASESSSGQYKQSSSFFDKYGIDPGSSVRRKASTPPIRPSSVDPPATSPGVGTQKSAQVHAPPLRRSSSQSPGNIPSHRTRFKTDATNDNEVEIELSHSPYSPDDDMHFEC